MDKSISNELFAILEKERAAIVSAKFDVIDEVAPIKEALFNAFIAQKNIGHLLPRLRQMLARNQDLLQAAMTGVESAQARLKALREVRNELRVYDPSGQISVTLSQKQRLSRRS